MRTLVLVILAVTAYLLRAAVPLVGQAPVAPAERLLPGKPLERELRGDQAHSYMVAVQSGEFLRVIVDQRGIDVVVTLFGPDGKSLAEVDSPNGMNGPEPVSVVAEVSGTYRLQVRSLEKSAPPARYQVLIEELRQGTPRDRDRIAAERLEALAIALGQRGTATATTEAIATYSEALAAWRRLGDRRREAYVLTGIAGGHFQLGRLDSALAYYRESIAVHREVRNRAGEGEALHNIGHSLSLLGARDSALVYYHLAIAAERESGERLGEGATLNNIGLVYREMGQADSALLYYRRALVIRREVGDRDGESATLHNLGGAQVRSGRPDSALRYYHTAIQIKRDIGNRASEAITLNEVGLVQLDLGRPDSALAYFTIALAMQRQTGDRYSITNTLRNLGYLYSRWAKPDSAIPFYQEALAISRDIGDRPGEGSTLSSLSNQEIALGRHDSAAAYSRQALELAQETRDRAGEGPALRILGLAHAAVNRSDSALHYYDRALRIVREVKDLPDEGTILLAMADEHRRAGALGPAAAHYDSAAAIRATVAVSAGGEANRVSLAELSLGLFEHWARTWLDRAPDVGPVRSAAAALAAWERGRSQALLELMKRGSADVTAGGDLVAEGTRLIEQATRGGAAVLSYAVTADTLLLWFALAGRDIKVVRQPISRDTLTELVRSIRRGLGGELLAQRRVALRGGVALDDEPPGDRPVGRARSFDVTAERLASWLLPPDVVRELGRAREVVIIPHGVLGLVPFAALPIDSLGTLLGSRHGVRYAPSLAVLGEAEARPGLGAGMDRSALRRALVVGNPVMPRTSSLGEEFELGALPAAGAESRAVAIQLGATALTGTDATEARVRERLASASIVHLATHGYAYATEARTRWSFIALTPGSGHDGFLTVGEVLDDPSLTLAAELVVLSACETGLGNLRQAEGTVGLQRAFLAKGARSVLVSLWNVSDAATRRLMEAFYRHWLGGASGSGSSKAEALRRAQDEVRKTPGFEHPRFWAAFQLVGAS